VMLGVGTEGYMNIYVCHSTSAIFNLTTYTWVVHGPKWDMVVVNIWCVQRRWVIRNDELHRQCVKIYRCSTRMSIRLGVGAAKKRHSVLHEVLWTGADYSHEYMVHAATWCGGWVMRAIYNAHMRFNFCDIQFDNLPLGCAYPQVGYGCGDYLVRATAMGYQVLQAA
jgi:hypothetical protein